MVNQQKGVQQDTAYSAVVYSAHFQICSLPNLLTSKLVHFQIRLLQLLI